MTSTATQSDTPGTALSWPKRCTPPEWLWLASPAGLFQCRSRSLDCSLLTQTVRRSVRSRMPSSEMNRALVTSYSSPKLTNDASWVPRLDAHSASAWEALRDRGSSVYSWPSYCKEPVLLLTRVGLQVSSTHPSPKQAKFSQQANVALVMRRSIDMFLNATSRVLGLAGSIMYLLTPSTSGNEAVTYTSPFSRFEVEYWARPREKSCNTSWYRGPQWMKTLVSFSPAFPPRTCLASMGMSRATSSCGESGSDPPPPSSSSSPLARPRSSRSSRPNARMPIIVHRPVPRNSR
mmetsp:Transcript_43756/g.81824  ORF Transcript_43756/g.81824 Transcript_43756/m.81824 type:complete len:291 (-) Transcript_43756:617-1489(-)